MAILDTEMSAANAERQISVPVVSSIDQRSGITAGYVAQLNQTVLPTLVRGPQLEDLKSFFTDGAKIKRQLDNDLTDTQIDDLCKNTHTWINNVFSWLGVHVSSYAAERFAFRRPLMSYCYTLPGQHAAGYGQRWGVCRDELCDYLTNLDQLMRDPSIYPEAP